jgi:hypothetical protein
MSKIVQADNINAGQYYLNGYPTHSGGGVPHTMLPVGSIIMWNGSASNIPSGWHICNGENDTPDLRERFVIGAGNSFAPRSTGGSFTITATNLPKHGHNIETSYLTGTIGNPGTNMLKFYGGVTGQQDAPLGQGNSGSFETHVNIETGNDKDLLDMSGTSITQNNYYPPYCALYYIMFTGQ